MVPTLYKMLIVTVRYRYFRYDLSHKKLFKIKKGIWKLFFYYYRKPTSTANLACHETFELLTHFNSHCQLKNNLLNENKSLSLKCLEELLKVIADYDIYQVK